MHISFWATGPFNIDNHKVRNYTMNFSFCLHIILFTFFYIISCTAESYALLSLSPFFFLLSSATSRFEHSFTCFRIKRFPSQSNEVYQIPKYEIDSKVFKEDEIINPIPFGNINLDFAVKKFTFTRNIKY
jgi:hypothetical protein